jgi:hypothetical protein
LVINGLFRDIDAILRVVQRLNPDGGQLKIAALS